MGREQMRDAATTIIFRECGANCARWMRKVTEHLAQAFPTTCESGQENLLIEPSVGASIVYRQNGRLIEFDGNCFINPKSINRTIKDSAFLFN
jgi:hypothetical protein